MRAAIALAALFCGCVDIHVADTPSDLCVSLSPTPAGDLASPPADLAVVQDMIPLGPRLVWLSPPEWLPVSGAWIVNADGTLLGSGTLRARVPAGSPPTEIILDYIVSAGSSARVWLRAWQQGADTTTTPSSKSVLLGVK